MSQFHAKAAAGILAGLTLLVGSGCIPKPLPLPEPEQTTEEDEATNFSGFEALPTSSAYDFANGGGGTNAVRPPGSDVLADDFESVRAYLQNHVRDALVPSNTLSGLAYSDTAIALICPTGEIPEDAVRRVKGDLLLVELLMQGRIVGRLMGVQDLDALVRAIAERLAASADAPTNDTATATSWIIAKRAWNDQIATAMGVRDAAKAVGGVRRLAELVATLQLLGGEVHLQDLGSPEWAKKLREKSPDRIVAEAAAGVYGLPPAFANRYANDLLRDIATLELIGFESDRLRDPGVQRDILQQGWQMFTRGEVLKSLGLPGNAGISASPGEILRQASIVQLMGGNHSNPSSYGVVREFDRMALSLSKTVKKVNSQNNGGQNPAAGSPGGSDSNATNSNTSAGPGPSPGDRPGSNPASPSSPSSNPGNTSNPGGSGGQPNGSQGTSTSPNGTNSSNSDGNSSHTPTDTSSSDDTTQSSDGLTFEVETRQTSDHTFIATEIWIASDGTRYEGSSVEFSDGDGDGTYTAATDSNWGVYEGSMPADGSHAAERDEDGTTTFQVDQSDTGGQSTTDSQEQADAADSQSTEGSMTQDQYYARQRLWLGFSNVFLIANARGNFLALALGDFRTGTGNSTPVPEGGSVGWISPSSDQEIPRWFWGDPFEADAARSGDIVPREDPSSHGGNVINPTPDAIGGPGAPYQIPSILPNTGPSPGGHVPMPIR